MSEASMLGGGPVLGIDFGGTKIAVGTAAPGGEPLRRVRLETRGAEGAHAVVRRALHAARDVLGSPAAVGVSTFGVIRDGRVRLAPNVPGWEGLELPRLLREEFGEIPVAIDNDVKAAAAAELLWGALRGVSTGLYLNLGTGLAAALVADGTVLRGAHGAAGEIGYLVRSPTEPAYAQGRAPLEERVSGVALARSGSALLGRPVTAESLFLRDGDPQVRALLEHAVDDLGATVANLCVILDPERVVVGGGMVATTNMIVPRLRTLVERIVPFPPEMALARFTDDAPLYGALALALRAAVRHKAR